VQRLIHRSKGEVHGHYHRQNRSRQERNVFALHGVYAAGKPQLVRTNVSRARRFLLSCHDHGALRRPASSWRRRFQSISAIVMAQPNTEQGNERATVGSL
jgi:hypothetical protein